MSDIHYHVIPTFFFIEEMKNGINLNFYRKFYLTWKQFFMNQKKISNSIFFLKSQITLTLSKVSKIHSCGIFFKNNLKCGKNCFVSRNRISSELKNYFPSNGKNTQSNFIIDRSTHIVAI